MLKMLKQKLKILSIFIGNMVYRARNSAEMLKSTFTPSLVITNQSCDSYSEMYRVQGCTYSIYCCIVYSVKQRFSTFFW